MKYFEVLLSPAGEGTGHKFRVSQSHQFAWGFIVVLINEDLTTGPGVVGGFAAPTDFLARRRACLACSRKNNTPRILDKRKLNAGQNTAFGLWKCPELILPPHTWNSSAEN